MHSYPSEVVPDPGPVTGGDTAHCDGAALCPALQSTLPAAPGGTRTEGSCSSSAGNGHSPAHHASTVPIPPCCQSGSRSHLSHGNGPSLPSAPLGPGSYLSAVPMCGRGQRCQGSSQLGLDLDSELLGTLSCTEPNTTSRSSSQAEPGPSFLMSLLLRL